MLALAYLSVLRRSISLFEILFASAANEPSADEPSMAPLLVHEASQQDVSCASFWQADL